MKVKLLTSMAGEGFAYRFGEEVELSANEAKRFIARGLAEPVRSTAVETASVRPPERAAARGPARKAKPDVEPPKAR